MENGIGSTLRKARNRRKIDLSEVEASTRIRGRYLSAMENEEWDVLPGGPYTRSFIRTYATYLGLDGDRLADDYKRSVEPSPAEGAERGEPSNSTGVGGSSRRLLPGAWVAIGAVALVVAIVVIGPSGGDGTKPSPSPTTPRTPSSAVPAPQITRPRNSGAVVLGLAATADVWVCLLDENGRALVDGQILGPGTTEGPFHSGSFTVSFGNGEVSMKVDGQEANIPATSSPIGYSIDSSGKLRPLLDSQRPTCT